MPQQDKENATLSFILHHCGVSLAEIAVILNAKGIKSKYNREFTPPLVLALINGQLTQTAKDYIVEQLKAKAEEEAEAGII